MNFKLTDTHVLLGDVRRTKEFMKDDLNGVQTSKGLWKFPRNYHSMRELARSFTELRNDSNFVEAGQKMRQAREHLLEKRRTAHYTGEPRLRPYQAEDVGYLKELEAAAIFNEPRTGKTPTTITLIKAKGTRRNLIICPASLTLNWEEEFALWFPMCKPFVVKKGMSPAKRMQLYDAFQHYTSFKRDHRIAVLLLSKDTLKQKDDLKFFGKFEFDFCAVDEAHFLRNYESTQSKAVFKVKAKNRFALTGTPTVKHGSDIYGILHFLYPDRFTSYWQFTERYWHVGTDWAGRMELGNPKELRSDELHELVGMLSVQRLRKDVMHWLPDKETYPFHVEMGAKQRKLYRQMLDDFFVDDVVAPNTLTQMLRLRQLCLDPRLLGFDVRGAKTDALLEWIDNNQEPVVIMSEFSSYLRLFKQELEKKKLRVGIMTGDETDSQRENYKRMFQSGCLDVLLCNIKVAGVGHTLDRAETVIFTDLAWNPADNEQAEDRICPVSEERNHKHMILHFQIKDTVDERMNEILRNKVNLTSYVNNGGREAIEKLLQGTC